MKLSADKAEGWVPTQNLEASLAALSEASGVPLAKCEIHRHDLGGGFGRRGGTQDYVHQAVEIAKAIPGHAGQDDMEPRGGPGARLLPADLAVQVVRRPRRRRQPRRPARSCLRPVDQCHAQSERHRRRQGHAPAARLLRRARRRAARLRRAEPADRICDAQHAMCRSGPGAASTPIRTPSTWNASWTRWRRRRARTRSNFAAR